MCVVTGVYAMVLRPVIVERGTESPAPKQCNWSWGARQHRHITHDQATWSEWREKYFETPSQRQLRARARVSLFTGSYHDYRLGG